MQIMDFGPATAQLDLKLMGNALIAMAKPPAARQASFTKSRAKLTMIANAFT